MLSSITSYFWGSSENAENDEALNNEVSNNEVSNNETSNNEASNNETSNNEAPNDSNECSTPVEGTDEAIMSDDRLSPDPLISLSSLSDEETDWVMVNNAKNEANNVGVGCFTKEEVKAHTLSMYLKFKELQADFLHGNIFDNRRQAPTEDESDDTTSEISEPTSRMGTRSSHNNTGAFTADSALKALQAKAIRPEQKAERRDKESRLKYKHLEKANMSKRVASSCNRPSKRSSRYTPTLSSRAVNNRKC